MTDLAALGLSVRSDGVVVATEHLDKFKKSSDEAAKGADNLGAKSKTLQSALAGLARAAAPLAAGLAAAFSIGGALREAEKFETTMFRVQAVINATGGVAGRSADQLREQARQLAWSTLESTEGVLRAQQTLLTFRNVQGEIFDRAIVAAADMSAALGGDLNSATMQLAKALENPVQGLTALTRSGTVFTEAQKEMVKGMVEAGRTADAQRFILSELEAQYGGTAKAAAGGLAGAQDTLGQAFQELKLAIAESLGLLQAATTFNNTLAGAVIALTDAIRGVGPAADVMETALSAVAVVVVTLAATQIPALVAALTTKLIAVRAATAGLTLMHVQMYAGAAASAVMTTAMRTLGVAVAFAGGPFGLLLAILGGVTAAAILFRDTTNTVAPIVNQANEAVDGINKVLATSSESALPAAARETLNLTNENIKLARSAYAAAEAEVAKAQAIYEGTQFQLGVEQAFSPTGDYSQASEENQRAMMGFSNASARLAAAQKALTDRVNEGQLSLSQATEALDGANKKAIELTVTSDNLGKTAGGAAKKGIDEVAKAAKEAQKRMDDWANNMAGHFDGLITGGKNLSGVLQSMARQLESTGWQMLFKGLARGIFGGGGGFLGSLFAGFFDQGGMIPAGQVGIVGERGPEFVRGPAVVTSRADTARALAGGAAGGVIDVVLHVPEGVTVQQATAIAGSVAVRVTQGGLAQNRQALPRQIDQLNARGR
jgi:hypothetical protein